MCKGITILVAHYASSLAVCLVLASPGQAHALYHVHLRFPSEQRGTAMMLMTR